MGNKKNIILILVIVVLFVASGLIVYNGIFSKDSSLTFSSPHISASQKEIVNLLPYGDKLDFSSIQNRSQNARAFTYEQVDAASVGVDIHGLIATGGENTSPTQVNPKK